MNAKFNTNPFDHFYICYHCSRCVTYRHYDRIVPA